MGVSYTGVNTAAFCLSTTLAVGTTAAVFAAATATSTVAIAAFGFFALGLAGAAGASVTAWTVSKSTDEYFEKFARHAGVGIAAMFNLAAQRIVHEGIQWAGTAVGHMIYDALTGKNRRTA